MFATSPLMVAMLGILSVQWQLIGRIDGVMKLKKSTMSFNLQYPFSLMIKMCWSKNIQEERESPVQTLLGSMDPLICLLLNLAAFLEFGGGSNSTKLIGSCSNWSVANSFKLIFWSPSSNQPNLAHLVLMVSEKDLILMLVGLGSQRYAFEIDIILYM